jgi:hypothetical protein
MLYTIDSNLYEVLGVAENETFAKFGIQTNDPLLKREKQLEFFKSY